MAEYGMPFYMITSGSSLISAHISLNHSNKDEHLLGDFFIPAETAIHFPSILSFNPYVNIIHWGLILFPFVQMGKLRLRKIEFLTK